MANSKRKTARAKGRQYKVQDRQGLRALIAEALVRDHGGSRNQGAKAVGIPHSTLKRYHDGRGASIRHETLDKLKRLIGPAHLAGLEKAVLTFQATTALLAYDRWLNEETRSTLMGSVMQANLADADDAEFERVNAGASAYDRGVRLDQLCARWETKYADEYEPLKRRLAMRGHFNPRARLAFLRILAPLLDFGESDGIERSWSELTDRERRKFIRAGVTREVILLSRENDVQRAQDTNRVWEALTDEYSLRPPWQRF
jgi:hypothetical protein